MKKQLDKTDSFGYCPRGANDCLDQNCPCFPSMSYRFAYLFARGCYNPLRYLFVVVTTPLFWALATIFGGFGGLWVLL